MSNYDIETKWVNLKIVYGIAYYTNISGLHGNGYDDQEWKSGEPSSTRKQADDVLSGFNGLAAISLDEYRCRQEDCSAHKYQLRIEGMIPGASDPTLETVEVHAYARTSMNSPERGVDEFLEMTSWNNKITGIICGETVEVRHAPPPPGFPWKIRSGQTLSTWAKSGPELPCNIIDDHPCPFCKEKLAKEWQERDERRVQALIKTSTDSPVITNTFLPRLDDEEE